MATFLSYQYKLKHFNTYNQESDQDIHIHSIAL